jgi:hypothetical protein
MKPSAPATPHDAVVVDTDIGGDPDDALALAAAARAVPGLSLVVTTDETGAGQGYGQRARFARHLLDWGCPRLPPPGPRRAQHPTRCAGRPGRTGRRA